MRTIETRDSLHQQHAPEIQISNPLPDSEARALKIPLQNPDPQPMPEKE